MAHVEQWGRIDRKRKGERVKPTPPASFILFMAYKRKKAALDEARDEAIERAIASGDITKQQELLSQLDQMTRKCQEL